MANELGLLKIYECFELNGNTIRLHFSKAGAAAAATTTENIEIVNKNVRLVRAHSFSSHNRATRAITIRNAGLFALERDALGELPELATLTITHNRLTELELEHCGT